MKTALITGITGHIGSHLAEFLLNKQYKVYGMVRRSSNPNFDRINHILDKIEIIQGDLTDEESLNACIDDIKPDEVYNLASQSFVPTSWSQPILTGDVTGLGVTRLLNAIKRFHPKTRFYQASSSEMFGKITQDFQNENTRFYPRSPYGVAKLYGYWITVNFRESYDMFACNGITFNCEGPRRGLEFVTRKITDGVAKIKCGLANSITLGNLDAKRDWGYVGDYVNAMWLILQQEHPDDFVIATGVSHTVRDFVQEAFDIVGIKDWENYVKIDRKFFRPAEVTTLLGDSTKAKTMLGWQPKTNFKQLVKIMVDADLQRIETFKNAQAISSNGVIL